MDRRRAAPVSSRVASLAAGTSLLGAMLMAIAPAGVLASTTRNVPADFPTIQAAISAAVDGDTVLVAPGTYHERIDFLQKSITVQSSAGRASTTIDGGGLGVVVKMVTDASDTPTFRGFTVTGGGGSSGNDGGIDQSGGPALIEDNLVTGNRFCDGGGIEVDFSSATVRNNTVTNNSQQSCSGGSGGGGVSIGGAGTVQLIGNVIDGNHHGSWAGGISLFAAGTPTIERNVVTNNGAGSGGGAMWIVNASNATIRNNLFANNTSPEGGAIDVGVPSGEVGPLIANNTFAGNTATQGAALYVEGFPDTTRITNNLITGGGSGAQVFCDGLRDPNPPTLSFNDVVATGGTRYGGVCPDPTGSNGNISASPSFVDAAGGNYHLTSGSAGIDSGTGSGAPPTDIDGDPRPQDGNGDGTAAVDLGFDEVTGALGVGIDILPGTTPNLIKLNGKGLTTAVGLLSSPGFDARQAVTSSLCFGDAEAPAQRDCTLAKPVVVKDLDRDGDLDLSLVFDNAQTGIDMGDTQACLNGRLASGALFTGCDTIVTR
jgi:hypothetical protein